MLAGEQGADYVAFPHNETELLKWWSNVAELPGVAEGVSTSSEASTAQSAGVDFLDVRLNLDGKDAALLFPIIAAVSVE
ncbi:hypothetical protein AA106555_1752 [Neokomagataea thailandica NBRC 106555]|nr:hypothetical protein AA106555_1752 [Neokomagataea thailandica NBRC 106555]